MAETRRIFLRGGEIFYASSTVGAGSPGAQLDQAVTECREALAAEGLSASDLALVRLWMNDRDSAAQLDSVRDSLLRKAHRAASSSFFSRNRMAKDGVVAVEFYAVRPRDPSSRRIVDFDPPRRYAHYLCVDDWLFLSGMAEEGETMDLQFDRAFTQVQARLDAEG